MNNEDSSLLEKIRDAFSDLSSAHLQDYPKEAMKRGTLVRSTRLDKLGFIYDAFSDQKDLSGNDIITYSILLLPTSKPYKQNLSDLLLESSPKYYMTNEYEYDVIGYLMINPIDVSKLNLIFDRNLF